MKGSIFVTVGTDPQPFDRLLREIDRLAEKKFFLQPVFCQTGYSTFIPPHVPSKAFLSLDEFEKKILEASLVVSHGGAGSIGAALQHEKKCIVVPRLKKFGEHANDHQLELVNALGQSNRILAISDEKKLEKAIEKAKDWKPAFFRRGKLIVHLLDEFVEQKLENMYPKE